MNSDICSSPKCFLFLQGLRQKTEKYGLRKGWSASTKQRNSGPKHVRVDALKMVPCPMLPENPLRKSRRERGCKRLRPQVQYLCFRRIPSATKLVGVGCAAGLSTARGRVAKLCQQRAATTGCNDERCRGTCDISLGH